MSEGLAVVDGLAGAGVEHVHNPLVRLVSGELIEVLKHFSFKHIFESVL